MAKRLLGKKKKITEAANTKKQQLLLEQEALEALPVAQQREEKAKHQRATALVKLLEFRQSGAGATLEQRFVFAAPFPSLRLLFVLDKSRLARAGGSPPPSPPH